jgi:cellulose synthase/poly-beta-1,6-N-acetylglucosamine synthase-like glycosyltransferase
VTYERILVGFNAMILVYLVLLNLVYLTMGLFAFRHIRHYVLKLKTLNLEQVIAGADTLPISLLVPAYNEEASIVASVRSYLALRYPDFEVLVVNDGSTDATMDVLIEAFEMRPMARFTSSEVPTERVRSVYRSERHPTLWLIDKENGGKADALNAGLNYCRTPIFCAIDADTLLEPDSLVRAIRPFLEDQRTVASGGIVRVANGCTVTNGLVSEVHLPRSFLARIQVLEYLRAFLSARMGWDVIHATLIISGAFGAFRRSVVADAGGFSTDTVAEDMELVVRLHRYCRDQGIPYRVRFTPDPIAWTECPEDLESLGNQRDRWQRGLAQVLSRHRRMFMNPRYGPAALVGYTYFLVFELVGPVIEALGYLAFVAAVLLGIASWSYIVVFLALAFVLGVGLNVAAVGLEELSFRRYTDRGDFSRLLLLGLAEGFGYRQLQTWWRVRALVSYVRGEQAWGKITRRGFREPSAEPGTASVVETEQSAPDVSPETVSDQEPSAAA